MLDLKRRQRLVAFVVQNNGATVAELAEQLGVSQATVRRDLARLDQQGLIERAHGGAAPRTRKRTADFPEPPVLKRAFCRWKRNGQLAESRLTTLRMET